MTKDNRRFDSQKRDKLLGPDRLARWNPPRLLSLAGLQAGRSALDLGCGPGFWTMPMAEIVGTNGQVIALDVNREMLDSLAAQSPPAHVRLLQGELPGIALPGGSVDFVWAAFIFHEVVPPALLAAELRRVLSPDGRLAVLEWRPDAPASSVSRTGGRLPALSGVSRISPHLARRRFVSGRGGLTMKAVLQVSPKLSTPTG